MLGKIMNKVILLAGISMLLVAAMSVPVRAQWDIAIAEGDWFLYEGTLTRWISDEGFEFPPFYATYLQDYNESDWMRYTVGAIDYPNVTWSVMTHWTNGTETTVDIIENVTSSSEIMVIGANLTQGAEIRPADMFVDGPRTLNASINLDTSNGTKETNVLDYSYNFFGSDYAYKYYWDAMSGIQVYRETHGDASDFTSGAIYNFSSKLELVDSSVGAIVPDLTAPILLLTIMSVTVPIALLHRRKKPTII
jgi:hypothetical protein